MTFQTTFVDDPAKAARYGPLVTRVNSESELDTFYEVRRKDGKLVCNCKGWIFDKKRAEAEGRDRSCKHIRGAVRRGMAEAERLNATSGVSVSNLPTTVQEWSRAMGPERVQPIVETAPVDILIAAVREVTHISTFNMPALKAKLQAALDQIGVQAKATPAMAAVPVTRVA
jgi:hypothetical protein